MKRTPIMCPVCGVVFNGQKQFSDNNEPESPPVDGDIACCGNCLSFNMFTNNCKSARPLSAKEVSSMPLDARKLLYSTRELLRANPLPKFVREDSDKGTRQ